jgi:glycosyltransferase involved in cell wall biosynthesis
MHISVVICTYNRSQSLRGTLASLAEMEVPSNLSWELIVVDNNSADDTRAVIEEIGWTSGLKVQYVFEGKQGLSHARNAGVRAAEGEIIAFTDDDVRIDPHWLGELANAFKEFDCVGVGGKSIPAWDGLTKPEWLISDGPYRSGPGFLLGFDLGEDPTPTKVPPRGLNMAFRKSAFDKYGLFRTDLGVVGSKRMLGEDTEFGTRLIKAGERVVYAPDAVVRHPIDPRRLTKSYVLSHYFAGGRTSVRMEGWSGEAVCYFGVPRYRFRELATTLVKWIIALDAKKRFYFKLQVYEFAGWIYEAFRLSRERRQRRG